MTSLLHHMISMGRRDFVTLPPLSSTQGIDPGPWSDMPRGYQQRISIAHFEPREVATLVPSMKGRNHYLAPSPRQGAAPAAQRVTTCEEDEALLQSIGKSWHQNKEVSPGKH
jgi:hypothetical protein